jgi:hypothetical protein
MRSGSERLLGVQIDCVGLRCDSTAGSDESIRWAIACFRPPDARTPARTIADRSRMVVNEFRIVTREDRIVTREVRMVARESRMVAREGRMVARQLRRAPGVSARSHRVADARLPIPGGHKPVRMTDRRSRTVARRWWTPGAASGSLSPDSGRSRRHSCRSLAGWDDRLALSEPRDPVSDRQYPGRTDASTVRSEAGSRR